MPAEENVSLFDNPILFRAWDIDWSVVKVCLVTGAFLWLLSILCGWILVRHTRAEWQRMSSAEAADLAANAGRAPHERFGQVYAGKAVGASVEVHAGIDDLRRAARRGDWLTFWLWPILLSCAFGGCWLFFSGCLLADRSHWVISVVWILLTIFCVAAFGAGWFMPWAALYTNIDAGTARSIPGEQARP
jgi:hypothetical protein